MKNWIGCWWNCSWFFADWGDQELANQRCCSRSLDWLNSTASYVCGEESGQQVKLRARLGVVDAPDKNPLLASAGAMEPAPAAQPTAEKVLVLTFMCCQKLI